MYVGKTDPIPLPSVPEGGKLITLGNGYIYYVTESYWDKVKKRTIDNRIGIGKLDPNNSEQMFPNKAFARIFGQKQADADKEVASLRQFYSAGARRIAGRLDFTVSYGPFAVLRRCAERTGLWDSLKRSMPRLWREVFALAVHAVCAEQSCAQSFPGWAFDHWCGLDEPPSDSTISRLYRELSQSPECLNTFFELYRENFHKLFPCSRERVVAFDSTNQVTESRHQSQARRGKAKTGEALPVISTAMYVDEITGISLWYEHFDGNILDKTETPYSVAKAQQLGFNKLFLMMDRGYYSENSETAARKIDLLGIGFGMMMPETIAIVSRTIASHQETIRLKELYYVPEEDIYGCQTDITLPSGNSFYAYVYYDDHTAVTERNAVHAQLNFFMGEAQSRQRFTDKMQDYFARRGIIVTKSDKPDQGGRNFTLSIDHEMAQRAYDGAGFFMVLSNRLMTAADMIKIARRRDSAEKAFRDLKSHFSLARTYTHSTEAYNGKMFVSFVSLVLLQAFRWFERQALQSSSSATTATLLSELGKYKIQERKDGTWMPVYALNKLQKSLLEGADLTEADLEEQVRGLQVKRL